MTDDAPRLLDDDEMVEAAERIMREIPLTCLGAARVGIGREVNLDEALEVALLRPPEPDHHPSAPSPRIGRKLGRLQSRMLRAIEC